MRILTLRVLKLYFRDKVAVFFSLLSSFIMIVLYIVFLSDTYTSSLSQIQGASQLMNQWVMAGILATSSVSTTIATFSMMVEDRSKKIEKDFDCSPIHKKVLIFSYYIAGLIVGYVLSLITLLFAQIYILYTGGNWFGWITTFKIIMILFLVVIMNGSMMFYFTSFFKSHHAFSTATTLIGTLIGFMTGIYVPIGSLPEALQWLIKLFPTSHGAALLRQIMMETSMSTCFQNVTDVFVTNFQETFGVFYSFGQVTLSSFSNILYMIIFTFLFLGMTFYFVKRKN